MPLKMLCVVAHPDDECYAFGGAIALATRAGVETSVICLTDGQAATNRGNAASGEDLGKMRRAEFKASCKVLGVTEEDLWDYQDGQLEHASVHEVAGRLVQRIRTWKPDVILTFGGDGAVNTHADHTMVSFFTTAAFYWAARSKRYPELNLPAHTTSRLFHLTSNFALPDREPLLPAPWTVTLEINEVMHKKIEAFRQHPSQMPVFEKVKPYWDQFGTSEHYVLAAATTPQAAQQLTSFFHGLS